MYGAVLLALAAASIACGQDISASDAPEGTLARRLEAGSGFSIALAGTKWENLAGRMRVASQPTQAVFDDPATGLRVIRRAWALPGSNLRRIETALANGGKNHIVLSGVRVGDWTFHIGGDGKAARYRPLTYREDTWYGSTYWTGPDWTRVGKDWHHPGRTTSAIRCFTAPRDGRVSVTGRAYKADTHGGDGVALAIRHRSGTVWQAQIDARDAKGVEHNLTLDVRKGDAIRFIVHRRGAIEYDTTHWDPLITYARGGRFLASEGFSTRRQGEDGWSYEMESDDVARAAWPTVHAPGVGFSSRAEALPPEGSVETSSGDALPLIVLADGGDGSGVLIAPAGPNWRLRAATLEDGRLRVEVMDRGDKETIRLGPGESATLAPLIVGAYRGPWAHVGSPGRSEAEPGGNWPRTSRAP